MERSESKSSVMSTATDLMTAEEFLRLPDDGIERELIDGEVRERGMAVRNRWHTFVEAQIVFALEGWRRTQKLPRGTLHSGEVGSLLFRNPDHVVGIDVAYFPPEASEKRSEETTLLDGPPLLAVEILSPSDLHEDVSEKVRKYLLAGVKLVWVVDSDFETVTVHRNDAQPQLFNNEQHLTGEPYLPGFLVPVASLFRDA